MAGARAVRGTLWDSSLTLVPDSWRAPRGTRATSRFFRGDVAFLEAVLATVTHLRRDFISRERTTSVVDGPGPGPGPGPRRRRRVARRLEHRLVSLRVQRKRRYDTRGGISFVFQDTKRLRASSPEARRASIGCDFIRRALRAHIVVGKAKGSSHCCAAAGGTYAPPP